MAKLIHVKNLEDYHPGYKDRTLIWGKIYVKLVTHPKYRHIPETDKWRLVSFILLELHFQEPIPLEDEYLKGIGFDLKKRPISLTLQMLHNFLEVRNDFVTQSRVDKSRVDKNKKPSAADAALKKVYDDEFNIYQLLETLRKKRKWKRGQNLPDEVIIAVCNQYWKDKGNIKTPWPWFMKVLSIEAAQWGAAQSRAEGDKLKEQTGVETIGDIMNRIAGSKAVNT